MMSIKLKVDGVEWIPEIEEAEAVAVEAWYDRHRREWVIYPVDADGNQIEAARYGFGKKEAMQIKKDIEAEYNI